MVEWSKALIFPQNVHFYIDSFHVLLKETIVTLRCNYIFFSRFTTVQFRSIIVSILLLAVLWHQCRACIGRPVRRRRQDPPCHPGCRTANRTGSSASAARKSALPAKRSWVSLQKMLFSMLNYGNALQERLCFNGTVCQFYDKSRNCGAVNLI